MSAFTCNWIGTLGGDWDTAADWSSGRVPDAPAEAATIAAAGSYIVSLAAGETITIGALTLDAGRTLEIGGTLDDAGTLTGSGQLDILHGGTLDASGTIASALTNQGIIWDTGGALSLDGPLSGSGILRIAGGGTIDLPGAADNGVAFGGAMATLELNQPQNFDGTIHGFAQTDTIALAGLTATGVTLNGNVLDVLDNAATIDTIQLSTNYAGASFSLTTAGTTAMVFETGISYAVEGETWASSTITWSWAQTNYAADATLGTFTDIITQAADQAVIEQALSEWSAVSGLTFVEVPDSQTADLRLGWSSFSGTEIGETDYSYNGTTFDQGVLIRLQDPAFDPLNSVNGTLIYSDTETSLLQLALHELGHSLGMAHTGDPDAIMYPLATTSNRQLDASDIAGIEALYSGDLACFAAGTRIATVSGEVAVEQLRIGDLLLAHRHRRKLRIHWLGYRHIDCRNHPEPSSVWPVQICAHAFAAGQPGRDLLLSPDHAIFFSGRLIPVKYLIDHAHIFQTPVDRVTYWHVELAAHDILRAEGLAVESYLDTGNRAQFVNADRPSRLLSWEDACAPLCLSGAPVLQARAVLAKRRSLVSADGTALFPAHAAPPCYRYLLPAKTGQIAIPHPHRIAALLIDGRLMPARSYFPANGARVVELRQAA